MATYYINADTGDDTTGDGSQGNPWLTFNYAESQASSGDTIIAQNSTNTYEFISNGIGKNLTLEGESVGGAVFDGGGLTPRWTSDSLAYTHYFKNIDFTNCVGYGIYSGIFQIGHANFINCRFYNLVFSERRAGIMVGLTDQTTLLTASFTSCAFYRNTGDAGSSTEGGFMAGGNNSDGARLDCYNCLFYFEDGYYVSNFVGDGNARKYLNLTNCIIKNEQAHTVYITGSASSASTMNYCCYTGSLTAIASGSGNINVDPLMIDPSNQNFNLSPSSPCIDAGTLV